MACIHALDVFYFASHVLAASRWNALKDVFDAVANVAFVRVKTNAAPAAAAVAASGGGKKRVRDEDAPVSAASAQVWQNRLKIRVQHCRGHEHTGLWVIVTNSMHERA